MSWPAAPSADAQALPPPALPEGGLRPAVQAYERQLIEHSLARHQGNWAAAARALQLDRANLHRLAKRLGITAQR